MGQQNPNEKADERFAGFGYGIDQALQRYAEKIGLDEELFEAIVTYKKSRPTARSNAKPNLSAA